MAPITHPASLHRSIRGRALLALLLAFPVGMRSAEKWIIGRSEHFEMYSSETEAESRHVLVALEQFRANFLSLFPLRGASEPRATVILFDRDSAFRPYKPLYNGKPEDVAGYFLQSPDELTIAMTSDIPDPEADPTEVIYHEYVHLLLDAREARFPLWLNEGLAEVFSTFKIEKGKVEYGLPKERHLALLKHWRLLPLQQLFAVTPESPDYNEEGRVGIFYAESWALTHYLVYGEDRSNGAKLDKFIQFLGRGEGADASFRAAFGADYSALDTALRRYLDGGGYFRRLTPAVTGNFPVTFRPALAVESDFALLNLRWRVHQDADAGARAHELLERDPTKPRPHELLAAIAARSDDMIAAQEHWLKAAELNSDNPWVYVQLLRDKLSPYQGVSMLDVRLSPDQIAPWRSWATRALALSPENADAIELAAVTEAVAARMDARVIEQVQRHVLTMRNPARALLALAIVHWRAKDIRTAENLVRLVFAEPRADMNTRAAANTLRYRFPIAEAPVAAVSTDELAALAAKSGILLQSPRVGEAARYLDQLLAERGTTAPRLELDSVAVHPPRGDQPDAWSHAEELRKKAGTGDPNAMFELAVAHACGTGVAFSPSLAAEWLQQAGDHGHPFVKTGTAPTKMDPELVAQFLRRQRPETVTDVLPPLDEELETRIADAAAAAPRHAPVMVYQAPPRFPTELRQTRRNGEALVRFTIRADGHPADVRATRFSDTASASAAEESVLGWRFIPAIRDGRPIGTYAEVQFTFESDKTPAAAAKS